MIPLRPFQPTADSLERVWHRFEAARGAFSDELPSDPFAFVCWIAADSARVFEIGPADSPIGVFIFTGVEPGAQAWAHLLLWDRDRYPPAEVIEVARLACRAMFDGLGLVRINGLTPVTNLPARVFAERVGFRVEGRLRSACSVGGMRTDAWVSGLLPGDLAPAESADTMDLAAASRGREESATP